MNRKDDDILKEILRADLHAVSAPENLEENVMRKIENQTARKYQPAVSRTALIIALFVAIALPVTFLILAFYTESEAIAVNIDVRGMYDMILSSPLTPIVGIILTYMAFDIFWQRRKTSSGRHSDV